MQLAIVTILFYGFFVSVAAGMTVIQDDQWRLGELIHATPLAPGEYIWAKFTAVLAGCALILVLHLASMLFFNHVLPNSAGPRDTRAARILSTTRCPRCSFRSRRSSFWRGSRSRSVNGAAGRSWSSYCRWPSCSSTASFCGSGRPTGLTPGSMIFMMWIDPSGFRWLNETWLKVDRGVSFYNNEAIPLDRGFLISRVVLVALGFLAVTLSRFHLAACSVARPRAARSALPPCSEPRMSPSSSPSPFPWPRWA